MPGKSRPVIDLSRCTDCDSCLATCPDIFQRNEDTGLMEVIDADEYPEEQIREAMAMCPADCISLEEW